MSCFGVSGELRFGALSREVLGNLRLTDWSALARSSRSSSGPAEGSLGTVVVLSTTRSVFATAGSPVVLIAGEVLGCCAAGRWLCNAEAALLCKS